jgi:pSer/pThr/pTyr-binding forkhead associated (FHA) protein
LDSKTNEKSLSKAKRVKLSKKSKLKDNDDVIKDIDDEEEGEVCSSDDERQSNAQEDDDVKETETKVNPRPEVAAAPEIYIQPHMLPCVRLIVESSDSLDAGSLLLVSYVGAQVGADKSCDVQIDDDSVDPLHARITYDEEEQCYWMRDLCSAYGSYVNDRLLDGARARLRHKDYVRFGRTSFLVHLHEQDRTCDDCEPGCVQALLAKQRAQDPKLQEDSKLVMLNKKQKEDLRRKELRQLQKKYGLSSYSSEAAIKPNYNDRADIRRRVKGSDCPYEKTDLNASSVQKPITENNKGFQLLKKAGWAGEESDLQHDSRIVDVKRKDDRRGLGS